LHRLGLIAQPRQGEALYFGMVENVVRRSNRRRRLWSINLNIEFFLPQNTGVYSVLRLGGKWD
jgi:hypothetical protein